MDRLAGLVARGTAKRNALPADRLEEFGAPGHLPDPFAGLSRPKRAILGAVSDMFGLLGSGDSLPWKVRPLVGMLQSTQPMLVTTVANMEEAEVRRILALVGDRITDALVLDVIDGEAEEAPAPAPVDA